MVGFGASYIRDLTVYGVKFSSDEDDLSDDNSTLVAVMAFCRKTESH